ncbi:MAG: SDR family oxidoreductase [Phycisphaerae bacterium]|nr:SDR family oxidoreductase [Phycisphaerae bacterium]
MPRIQDLFHLQDRVFLVVGGARNLGWDMSVALAEAGADGVITSRDSDQARAAAQRLAESTGRDIVGVGMDATDETRVRQGVEETVRRFDRIDILINCVGGGGGGATTAAANLEDRPLDAWEQLHRTNVTAPFLVCKHVVPVMRKRKSGSIINIASIAGIIGRDRSVYVEGMTPQPLDYASAKGAIIGFTRDLAAYVGRDQIRVNAISPGGFERGQPKGFIDAYSRKTVLGRMGRDGVDIKGAAVFLASDASAYVTGHNLVVDGGFTIWQ